MNRQERIVLILAAGVSVLLVIGFYLNQLELNDIYLGVFLAGFSTLAYIGYQRKWFESQLSQFQQGSDSKGYKDDWSNEEALEFAKEWSKRNYGSDDWIEFHWDNAEDATVRVPSGLEDVDMEKLYAVWTDHGPRNQGIQMFINCTTKERLNHVRLKFKEQRVRPFIFCDYYHEARRNSRHSNGFNQDNSQGLRVSGRGMGGLPADSLTLIEGSTGSNESDDDE